MIVDKSKEEKAFTRVNTKAGENAYQFKNDVEKTTNVISFENDVTVDQSNTANKSLCMVTNEKSVSNEVVIPIVCGIVDTIEEVATGNDRCETVIETGNDFLKPIIETEMNHLETSVETSTESLEMSTETGTDHKETIYPKQISETRPFHLETIIEMSNENETENFKNDLVINSFKIFK